MERPHRVERLQDHEVKRAVKEVRLVGGHMLVVYRYDVLRFNTSVVSVERSLPLLNTIIGSGTTRACRTG
jgi:hypothetical protein